MKKYSFSQINLYLKCPKAYEFAYIKKIPQRMSYQASFWTTIHKTLYLYLKQIKENKESPSLFSEFNEDLWLKWLLEIFNNSWISAWFDDFEQEKKVKKRWEKILKDFYLKNKNEKWEPLFLEKSFKLFFWDFILSGRFDRVDKINWKIVEIIDYKTWKIRDENFVKNDLQLILYSIAIKEMWYFPKKASLYFLDFDKKIDANIDEKNLENAKKIVLDFHKNILENNFLANWSFEKCKYCSFKNQCKYFVR